MDKDLIPISVLMPAYNAEKYIEKAIKSILDQTFKQFEFIIINDGSKDKTLEIARSFSDPRIRVLDNTSNQGLIQSLNTGLNEAKGKYIARMDADDIAFPERLQVQYDYLEKNSDVLLVGAWSLIINSDGSVIKTHRNPLDHLVLKYELLFGNTITHPSIMMRREIILNEGGYSKDWQHAEDYDLYSRLADKYKLANIGQPLLYYRQHGTSVTGTSQSQEIIRENTYKIMRRNISCYIPITDKDLWLITKVLTVRHPDGYLKLKDILNALRLHKKLFTAFIDKEKVDGKFIPEIKKYYLIHRNLMLTKYLIGKLHRYVK